jgi:hypothetical protein
MYVRGLLIGAEWSSGEGLEAFEVRAPFGGQLLATVRESTPAEVDAAVAKAHATYLSDGPVSCVGPQNLSMRGPRNSLSRSSLKLASRSAMPVPR